ncbi:MAG: Mut7-C RNAse domain-containing protein [Candidatus Omnitrophota bacterium]
MKFIVTKELGRLAKWLRILGYDVEYFDKDTKKGLVLESLKEERIILTRDTKLPRRAGYRTIHVHSDYFREQLKNTTKSLGISPKKDKLFSRCVVCNSELEQVEKENVKSLVPEYVYNTNEDFSRCKICKRVYWRGTHWGNMEEVVNLLR